ncbi:hypothetical protein VC03_00395 [Sneathia vaginalis]|uniref:Uncharacterized protein n=1 Tax=Sneathia vaginalis TaxID=187101 RepID=A0A0E3UTF8_9FUSO|nr:hypothetical protein [Sneathia vaginalis]AKC95054.1 hypothetical protein VC03_00395 [Sneathia vaginalis]
MKKTLLLTSLVASMVAMAGTTGSVKSFAESEAKFETKKSVSNDQKEVETKTTKSYEVGKIGVETEVKVKGSGLSFGGTFQAEKLSLDPAPTKDKFLDHSKVWAKYELPEIKGVKSFVKATAEPKFIGTATDKGSAELEGQVSYKYGEFTFGLNSKTNFPFVQKTANVNYGTDVKSTHKLFVESEEKKDVFVKGLKDVKASLEIKHNYAKTVAKAGDRVDYVSGEASAKYDAVKDLELEGKVAFKKNISGKEIGDYEILGTKLFEKANARYIHSYELKGTYTGVKHLSLSANPFVVHVNVSKEVTNNKLKRNDDVLYGVELGAEYKMLNDKLTLTGKSLLAGIHIKTIDETASEDSKKLVKENLGVFVFDANAKYDYSVTDKFTVSPEANANLELLVSKPADKLVTKPTLTLTPKVSAKYVPVEGLTIEGEVSVPVKFGVVTKSFEKDSNDNTKYVSTKPVNGFGYDSTSIKTSLNLKYEWK